MCAMPAFRAKTKGPLSDKEHEDTVDVIGPQWDKIAEFFSPMKVVIRGRFQSWGVCFYAFYDQNAYDANQVGLVFRVQPSRDGEFEIVFGPWEKQLPLPAEYWERLGPDQYKANDSWRAVQVDSRQKQSVAHARHLVDLAIKKFSATYSSELSRLGAIR